MPEDRYSNDEAGAAYFERNRSEGDHDRPNLRDEEDDYDFMELWKSGALKVVGCDACDNPYGYDEEPF